MFAASGSHGGMGRWIPDSEGRIHAESPTLTFIKSPCCTIPQTRQISSRAAAWSSHLAILLFNLLYNDIRRLQLSEHPLHPDIIMPWKSDTAIALPTPKDDAGEVESNRSASALVLPHRFNRQWSSPTVTPLSPPPVSNGARPQRKKSHLRLGSDSGLALHTNKAAFRQYTSYNPDGSVPNRPCCARTLSADGNSSVEDLSLGSKSGTELRGFLSNGRLLPDFFETAVVKLAFSNQTTSQRLRKFAETRYGRSDIEFLLKVSSFTPITHAEPRY